MFKKFKYFIKYNNTAILLLLVIFIFGSSVFATEAGKDALGQKITTLQGVDNTLLLQADFENFDMEYKIERIESDDLYYYVTFTFIDLKEIDNAWQYELQEKTRKVSKKIKIDLSAYLAEELKEERNLRVSELKSEQAKALQAGEQTRVETTEYSGLIGAVLNVADKVFPGYEPVTKQTIPPPEILHNTKNITQSQSTSTKAITDSNDFIDAYEIFLQNNDSDNDGIVSGLDNCPEAYNPNQLDSDNNGTGDICESLMEEIIPDELNNEDLFSNEIMNVEIIDLEPAASSSANIDNTPELQNAGSTTTAQNNSSVETQTEKDISASSTSTN